MSLMYRLVAVIFSACVLNSQGMYSVSYVCACGFRFIVKAEYSFVVCLLFILNSCYYFKLLLYGVDDVQVFVLRSMHAIIRYNATIFAAQFIMKYKFNLYTHGHDVKDGTPIQNAAQVAVASLRNGQLDGKVQPVVSNCSQR